MKRLGATVLTLASVLLGLPAVGSAQATSPTTVNVKGGAQGATQTVPTGTARFGLRVPLKPNAENVLQVIASDAEGRTVKVDDLKIAQISLTEIVQARVTATRLTTPEIKQLVAEGVINLADPSNYNVSRFVVALVVNGREVQVPVPVVRHVNEEFAEGPPISIGCARPGKGLSTTDRSISIPCGSGGEGKAADSVIRMIPFEMAPAVPGMPPIPGVILIEGRIKTLKEFFRVNLLLMNVSSLFTLTDLTARLEVPADALTPIAPAGGTIALPDIGPHSEANGQFIVRGDTKGIHEVIAHFGGKITGAFLPEPVAFSGSASTDLEVKGPPKLDVKVTHPDHVTAGEPYELKITVTNTDDVLDALYTSMAIDVGGGANLIDEATGEEIDGPIVRTLGDILKGETTVQTYKVMPKVTGQITSCVGAADANINLSVGFIGRDPGCAIGTLPSDRQSPDGKATVTVVPAHNTVDVAVDPPIVALFSQRMIEATITAGYAGASFTVLAPDGAVVSGSLQFTELFEATAAIFRPHAPLAFGTTYSIVVNPSIFNLDGLSLASGIVARFTTVGASAAPDTVGPLVTLQLEPPLVPQAIGRGQTAAIVASASDAGGVTRVDLLLDGELIDAKRADSNLKFLVETSGLAAGSSHTLLAKAYDNAGNVGTTTLAIQIAPDQMAPTAAIVNNDAVRRGNPLAVTVNAQDDGRVAHVNLFVDNAAEPVATDMVEPFQFSVQTTNLAPGIHSLRAVVADGAGNAIETTGSFQVTTDTTAPTIVLVSPQGTRFRIGQPIAFVATATDDVAVESIAYRLDAEGMPRTTGLGGFTLETTAAGLGQHTVTVIATDSSGNAATLAVPFEIIPVPNDSVPPPAANLALITLGPLTNGMVVLTGANGAVENNARVSVTNTATQAGANAAATAAGAFTTQIEAAGGNSLSIVVIDDAGNRSPAVAVTVPVPAVLTSITVSPATVALTRSLTQQQLTVVGLFSNGTQQTLVSGVTFASSMPTVASATNAGLLLPGANGSSTITVSVATPGVAPVAVPVTVDFSTIVGISASPNPLTLAGLGRSQRLAVNAQFADNTSGPFNGTRQFGTANPNVAIVDSSGLVTSTGVGSTTVTVAATGFAPASVLVVVEGVQPTELIVTPTTIALTSLGESRLLDVRYRFSDGTLGSGAFAVTFQSLDPAVASVSSTGQIVATGEGSTTIVVRSLSFAVSVPVSVTLPTTLPPPEITSFGRPIAAEGDTLAILGRNFAGTPAQNFVTINGRRAEVVGASGERVIAIVPPGAATGPVQVRVGGQTSNAVTVNVYPRRAKTLLSSLPFDVPSAAGQSVDLGSASFYLQPGDDVVVSSDPNTIVGPTWSGLVGPSFTGTLVLTVNGTEHVVSSATQAVNINSLMPNITEPTLVTIAARVDALGSALSSRGIAFVAGPPNTGAFIGQRFSTGDAIAQQTTLRFRLNVPDGTKYAVTAATWYRLSDGAYHNSSAGGTIIGGVPTPNDGDFRTFTVTNGELVVTYSDASVYAGFGETPPAVIAVVPANASNNNRVGTTPVAEARVLIGVLDSASILPQDISAIADGVDRPISGVINSVRDLYGNAVLNGTRLAVTSRAWYRRSDGGYHNGSTGGVITGGVATANDGDFRTFELVNGSTAFTYSPGSNRLSSTRTEAAVISATVASAANNRITTRPFAEGTVLLSSPGSTVGTVTVLPSVLSATSSDNRSVITLSNLTDLAGRPVPDGMRIAVAARAWYRASDGGYHNGSFGGTIVGGDPVPNDGDFRSFVVTGGQVSFIYSNVGLVLGRNATATTVIAILPADGAGNRIGERPFVEARITQGGISSASIVPTPSSTIADGTRRPIAVAVTNIRDALGNLVPDGTRIALTARTWYRASDGGYHNSSAGGVFIDGVATPNDGDFRTYTVENGRVDATYSAETISPLGATQGGTAVIAAVAASYANNNRLVERPFDEGRLAVSSIQTSTAVVSPVSLLADRQARTSVITISNMTDSQGRAILDGTKVAITARAWYRASDGGYHNGSAGGTMLGGEATPNDGEFRTYTVTNGQVTATYSSEGLFVETDGQASAVLSVLPAMPNGSRIGTRPFTSATITLAGYDSVSFVAPSTTTPSSAVSVTLTNIRDAVGNLVPDGAKVAVSAVRWYNPDGSYHNGSAGGSISGGVATPNDGDWRTFTVAGGQVTFTFNAPAANNVTSVITVNAADGNGNRITNRPFAAHAIRVQPAGQ